MKAYAFLPLLALALPALAQDPATNAPASPKNAIVCKIVKRLETSNVVTLRISNRTSDPVDIDMNEVAGYGPRFLRLRAFDKFGVCSTNTPGARPDGFYAPRVLTSQLSERTNLVASLSRLGPGESRKFSVDVRKFFDDAAPFKAIRRIQPQATLFLPSGEERTVIGPRFSFRGLDASSWLKSFRKETGRTASGTLVFLESDWSAIHPEDYVFDTLQVYFATAVEGHESIEYSKNLDAWIVDPESETGRALLDAVGRNRSACEWCCEEEGEFDGIDFLAELPDRTFWSCTTEYPDDDLRRLAVEIRRVLPRLGVPPGVPVPDGLLDPPAATESHAESAEGAEAEGGSGEAQPPPVETRAEVEESDTTLDIPFYYEWANPGTTEEMKKALEPVERKLNGLDRLVLHSCTVNSSGRADFKVVFSTMGAADAREIYRILYEALDEVPVPAGAVLRVPVLVKGVKTPGTTPSPAEETP